LTINTAHLTSISHPTKTNNPTQIGLGPKNPQSSIIVPALMRPAKIRTEGN